MEKLIDISDSELIEKVAEMWVESGNTPSTFIYYEERIKERIEKKFRDELAKEL